MNEISPDYRRILKTFRFEEPDRVPMIELTVDYPVQEAFLGRKIQSIDDEIDFWHLAGYDYMYLKPNYEFPGIPPVMAFGSRIKMEAQESNTDTSCDRRGLCALADRESLRAYQCPDPEKIDYSSFDHVAQNLPDGMGIIAGVGGVFARVSVLMGFENFCLSLFTDPEFVGEVFEAISSVQLEVAKRVVKQKGVFALWYSDDFAHDSAPMVSLDYIRTYLLPTMEKMAAIAHDAGMPFIYHGCGQISELLDELVELGVDALHPIEPKSMNIHEVKKKLYGKTAVIGNVPVGELLTLGTPRQIEEDVRERIRKLAPGGGYAVSSSNSISYYVPIANYRALLDSVRRYGVYPISC